MSNKGRVPSNDLRHPLPGPGAMHHDPYGSAIRPPLGGFPSFDMLPLPEVMEHKLSTQHIEISKLVKENQRLAATHETLRQDLATASNEIRQIRSHITEMESEKEQQTRGIMEKMSMMEAELKAAEAVKMELQQAHAEAHSLFAARQDLISKVQQLTRDLQMAHSDAQQIPAVMAELDSLRREYHHARATYDYEKKLYDEHLESLQGMEKNYMEMSREVDKLRAELTNFSNLDPRTGAGGPYSAYPGYGDSHLMTNYASGQNAYATGQNAYTTGQNAHPMAQGQAPLPGGINTGRSAGTGTGGPAGAVGNTPHVAPRSAPTGPGAPPDAPKASVNNSATPGTGYDPHRGHVSGYDSQRVPTATGPNFDAQRGLTAPGYDNQWGHAGPGFGPIAGYEAQRKSGYDAHGQVAPAYDMQKTLVNDIQRGGSQHDMQKGARYDPTANRGPVAPQGQVSAKNTTYASTAPNTGAGTGYGYGGNPAPR